MGAFPPNRFSVILWQISEAKTWYLFID